MYTCDRNYKSYLSNYIVSLLVTILQAEYKNCVEFFSVFCYNEQFLVSFINFALTMLISGNRWKKIDNYLVHGFTTISLLLDVKIFISLGLYIFSCPVFTDTVVSNLFASYKLENDSRAINKQSSQAYGASNAALQKCAIRVCSLLIVDRYAFLR